MIKYCFGKTNEDRFMFKCHDNVLQDLISKLHTKYHLFQLDTVSPQHLTSDDKLDMIMMFRDIPLVDEHNIHNAFDCFKVLN